MSVAFRPLAVADLPLVHRWLQEPHVRDTYGLGKGATWDDVRAKYDPDRRSREKTRMYVVLVDGVPAGYVQTYRILDHPTYAGPIGVDDESWGMDLFLGEPSLVGRGLGSRVIAQFAADVVFATIPAVAIVSDPSSGNPRSVRAFEKAGFRRWRTVVPMDESCGDLLLRLDRPLSG